MAEVTSWPKLSAYANEQAAPRSSTTPAIALTVSVTLTGCEAGGRPEATTVATNCCVSTGRRGWRWVPCTVRAVAGRSCPASHGRSTTPTIEVDTSGLAMSDATTRQVAEPHTPSVTFVHRYLSTACLHGEHVYCASDIGASGSKRPATCKFCDAHCVCACHPWSH